ncbi:MAG TPA: hypothetical protein VM580_33510, partial [Labilithrix sp.]|nr:hypothetical protein [Labilithrix sp.]
PGYRSYHLDQLLATGEVVWVGVSPIGSNDGRIALYSAEREALLATPSIEGSPSGPLHTKIRELFERRGALFFAEIARTVGGYPGDVLTALWDLVWSGEVTNDSLEPVRSLAREAGRMREGRRARAPRTRSGPAGSEGRWSLRRSRWEREPTPTERRTATGRALLERYGVVLREAANAEGLPGGFSYLYDVYRAMEEQGRLRRGYFVAGRGATQFALPGAEERLRAPLRDDDDERGGRTLVLAATDPANPWGSLLPWPDANGRTAQRAPGARVVLVAGRLIAWLSRGGHHVATFFAEQEPAASHDAAALARCLHELATIPRFEGPRSTMIATVDGVPAPESPIAAVLAEHGFVSRQGAMTFVPSTSSTFGRHARTPQRATWDRDDDVGLTFGFSRAVNDDKLENDIDFDDKLDGEMPDA